LISGSRAFSLKPAGVSIASEAFIFGFEALPRGQRALWRGYAAAPGSF
jgi:hypothetical protein